MRYLTLMILLTLCTPAWSAHDRKPLIGTVVVLDPGHGGRDPGCPFSMRLPSGRTVRYREAAYTYAAAVELAQMLRGQGATVVLTCRSGSSPAARSRRALYPLPIPRAAVCAGTRTAVRCSRQGGLRDRAECANHIYGRYASCAKKVLFLSLHVDSMPAGWSGSHVCTQSGRKAPALARELAHRLDTAGYARRCCGTKVRPLERRDLQVLRDNRIPEAVLLEMGVANNPSDSWRLRNVAARRRYLQRVVVGALIAVTRSR